MKKIILLSAIFILCAVFFTPYASAQPGTIDLTFNPGSGVNGTAVYSSAIQSDGKIIIAGSFLYYNGTARNYVARVNGNGTIDNTFNPGSGANYYLRAVTLQSNGKILIGGGFTSYNGTNCNYIVRLNTDGSLDNTFNPANGTNGFVFSAVQQSNGKIIIGGGFTLCNGTSREHIARINDDGSLDLTFDPGTATDGIVNAIALQTDGKIIIAGAFVVYNGVSRNGIARLNTDGSLDNSFDPGTGADDIVTTVSLQTDGKIIIGGYFNDYDGTGRNNIARLNTDGSLDNSFNPGTGVTGSFTHVETSVIQNNGKIVIGGYFTGYNGTGRNGIARVNTDGSLDNVFDPGTGISGSIYQTVYSTSLQTDGKIIVGGGFGNYNGTPRNCIVRVIGDNPSGITTHEMTGNTTLAAFPNPAVSSGTLSFTYPLIVEESVIVIYNMEGKEVASYVLQQGSDEHYIVLPNLSPGIYMARLMAEQSFSTKFSVE